MKNALIALVIVVTIVAGYFVIRDLTKTEPLARYGLDGMNVEELLETLEERTDEPSTLKASVTSSALTLLAEDKTYTFAIPDGWFYLSVAPYLTNTHPCGTHNLISCRGELKQETFHVLVENSVGEVILDETRTTHANGFMGLWLPSDLEGTLTVTYGTYSATADITTYATSNTCLTTMQLS